jgi:predicted molibdopterin-dependent oxidoreductase YjgC
MRLYTHPVLDFDARSRKTIHFTFNGRLLEALDGEMVAAALIANDIAVFRLSERLHEPRGIFCAIGRCGDCSMRVDGIDNVRICQTAVAEGMVVQSDLSPEG